MPQPVDDRKRTDTDNEHTHPDMHVTAREVAEGQAGDDEAPTPGGG